MLIRRPAAAHLAFLRTRKPSTMAAARSFSSYFVTPKELKQALEEQDKSGISTTIPVCASWFLPNDPEKRTGESVFEQRHIPHARFFDLDKVADTTSPYPHMLPSPETFQTAMSELGIRKEDRVVVYDSAELGIFSAPRVAWTFKVFGHPSVHILNNFKLWIEQGYPVQHGEQEQVPKTPYPLPQLSEDKVASFEEVKELAEAYKGTGEKKTQILDARSLGRWKGTDAEPRAGLSSGHIPGSISVPVPDLLDPTTKAFLPKDKLRAVFEQKGIDPSRPIVSSCGTGVTAAVIDAALAQAGFAEHSGSSSSSSRGRRVYDGSWTEWAQRVRPEDQLIIKST